MRDESAVKTLYHTKLFVFFSSNAKEYSYNSSVVTIPSLSNVGPNGAHTKTWKLSGLHVHTGYCGYFFYLSSCLHHDVVEYYW